MEIKTLEEALEAVKQDGRALVPQRFRTREMCLEAVKRRGLSPVEDSGPVHSPCEAALWHHAGGVRLHEDANLLLGGSAAERAGAYWCAGRTQNGSAVP